MLAQLGRETHTTQGANPPEHLLGSQQVRPLVDDVMRGVNRLHLSINTMGAGFTSVDEHLKALGSAAEALRLVPS